MSDTASELIRKLSRRKNIKNTEIAEKLGISSQNLSNKLRRNNFPDDELHKIAKILNCDYVQYFEDIDKERHYISRND